MKFNDYINVMDHPDFNKKLNECAQKLKNSDENEFKLTMDGYFDLTQIDDDIPGNRWMFYTEIYIQGCNDNIYYFDYLIDFYDDNKYDSISIAEQRKVFLYFINKLEKIFNTDLVPLFKFTVHKNNTGFYNNDFLSVEAKTNFTIDKKSTINSNLKSFIYKIDQSDKINVQLDCDSIDKFFTAGFNDDNSLNIVTADTNIKLITIEKTIVNDSKKFKFIVNINTEDDDEFKIKTTFDNIEKFNSLVESTINSLKEYKEFYKYAEDLENYAK